MKIRVIIYTVSIFIILLFQTTWLEHIRIMGVKPNLILVLVILSALINGYTEGAVVGAFSGFALDLVSGRTIGLYALLGLYAGLLAGYASRKLYKENYLVMLFFVFFTSVLYESAVYLLTSIGSEIHLLQAIALKAFPEAVYNSAVALIFYFIMIRINRRLQGEIKLARKY